MKAQHLLPLGAIVLLAGCSTFGGPNLNAYTDGSTKVTRQAADAPSPSEMGKCLLTPDPDDVTCQGMSTLFFLGIAPWGGGFR